MLPKAFRLTHRVLFKKTMGAGRSLCQNPYFLVLGLPRVTEAPSPTRYGFVVSKKVSNRAVHRNTVKRRLREIVRQDVLVRHPEVFQPYVAIVVIARKDALTASYQQMQHAMMKCLQKQGPQN